MVSDMGCASSGGILAGAAPGVEALRLGDEFSFVS